MSSEPCPPARPGAVRSAPPGTLGRRRTAGVARTSTLAEAEVDLTAVAANLATVADVAGTGLMAVVKADGFGHGAVPVARAALAAGASWLGVTSTGEALALRAAGLTAPVLSWLHHPDDDFGRLIAADVDLGVSTVPHLHAIADAASRSGRPATVQLKADTGLSRNGANREDWPDLVGWARRYEVAGSVRVRGIWSHLADAETPDCRCVGRQVTAFEEALRIARTAGLRPDLAHLANSAAALAAPATRYDLCRIGLALYGVDPFGGTGAGAYRLRAAMTLRSTVVNVKRVAAGTGVSYGPDRVTERPTTLALLPLGYADGLPRAAEGRAEVWLHGTRRPVVGRIAMDQCVVDAGDLPVAIGDPAVVFGPLRGTDLDDGAVDGGSDRAADAGWPTVAEWAAWARTSPHEILTGIGARIARRYRTAGEAADRPGGSVAPVRSRRTTAGSEGECRG
ncbi:alanine racemase [Plantactinospora sp. B6F1]|uniref:alanine racemase n=1 Tax=Plantactinospora sp. B6F1 TaxID=3158971 RepID=UPI0032D99C7E